MMQLTWKFGYFCGIQYFKIIIGIMTDYIEIEDIEKFLTILCNFGNTYI